MVNINVTPKRRGHSPINGRRAAEKNESQEGTTGAKNEKRVSRNPSLPIHHHPVEQSNTNCATHLGHLHERHGPLLHARPARAALHHHRETVLPPVLEGSRDLLTLCAAQRTTCRTNKEKRGSNTRIMKKIILARRVQVPGTSYQVPSTSYDKE